MNRQRCVSGAWRNDDFIDAVLFKNMCRIWMLRFAEYSFGKILRNKSVCKFNEKTCFILSKVKGGKL
jgi:hypothetical protein